MLTLWVLAQEAFKPTRPEGVWPVTISGWVTLGASSIALFVVLWRANNKPILDVLSGLEKKFDTEVKRIEERLEEVEADRKDGELKIIKQIDGRLDGFGARVAENKENITFLSSQYVAIAERMVRSEADRQQMNVRITETRMDTEHNRKALPDLEIRFTNALNAQTTTILNAQANLLRELPKMIQEAITTHVAAHPTHQHPNRRG